MSTIQWSYSSMKTFQTCPKQYKHVYILKQKEPPGEAAQYGTAVHKAIEDYIKDGVIMPAQYDKFYKQVKPVMDWPGTALVEHKMALGFDMQPCDFFDPNYFVRGVVDFIKVNGKRARILDWKTGQSAKYADIKQIELMSLLTFAHFPEVEECHGGLVFLVPDVVVPKRPQAYKKSDSKALWMRWLYEVKRMEDAAARDNFGPNPNGLCKKNCHVLDCGHNGRRM